MNAPHVARTLHKGLALIVGVQLAVWTLSGFYMVVVDLDFIHGDPLVKNLRTPLVTAPALLPVAKLSQRYPSITQISLRSLPGLSSPLYEITSEGRPVLLDAVTGEQLSPLPEATIRRLAAAYYAAGGTLASTRLIERDPPTELQSRALPLWRVDFDDRFDTRLYIHPDTGALVTRRHRYWRWFDALWMLHIMDYESRENVNNPLLRIATILALTTASSGVWLLYLSYRHKLPWHAQRARRTRPAVIG